jgi:GNAT superfamily N-acetyltransferase
MTTCQYMVVTKAVAAQYENLTYPAYREHLKLLGNSSIIAIGASALNAPVGLILAQYFQGNGVGEILSVFVVPEYRNQGIGSTLIGMMEDSLAQYDCQQAALVYIKSSSTATYLEKILQHRKWNEPQSRMLLAESNCLKLDNPDVIQYIEDCLQKSPLPADFTICPWSEVTSVELKKLQGQENIWYPSSLSPFQEVAIIEHTNSLGLRYQNEIVGWMITHRSTPNTIRYTSLFVREDLQRFGRAIPPWTLLFKSFFLQAHHSPVPNCSFTVLDGNDKMLRIINRRISPFLSSIRHSMGTTKFLTVL